MGRTVAFLSPPRAFALALAICTLAASGCLSTTNSRNLDGGSRAGFFLETVEWGRLVDVYDQSGDLVERDVLINPELAGDGINFLLATNPVTDQEALTILQDAGSPGFNALFQSAQGGLVDVTAKAADDAPPFTMVARNAAVRLGFSEHIDPGTVDFTTVQVLTGDPPGLAFTGRYVVDNDPVSGRGYVIFDPTVSAQQASQNSIPQNAVGFPESFDSVSSNLLFRVPTEADPLIGQPDVLTSLSGRRPAVKDEQDEPFEVVGADSRVLVRAMRTGNETDPYSGFMLDNRRPSLVGVFDVTISDVTSVSGDTAEFIYSLNATACRPVTPKAGDVYEIGDQTIAVVTDVLSSGDPNNYSVRANVESGELTQGATGVLARLTTRYRPVDAALQACFLDIQPPPVTLPAGRIDPNSTVTVRFDEPIDAATMLSMRTFVVASVDDNANPTTPEEIETAWFQQVDPNETVADYIDRQRGYDLRLLSTGTDTANSEYSGRIQFGPIEASDGNTAYTLAPMAGFAENNEFQTTGFLGFTVALRDGSDGIKDLAGNAVGFTSFVAGNDTQNVQITVRDVNGNTNGGQDAINKAHYLGLFGHALDEDGDGLAEWSGQLSLGPGNIGGRAPSVFSRTADPSNQFIGARNTGANINEPLNPAGAVVENVYRPQDFGFAFVDPTEYNMGVAGLSWAPGNGVVFDETFDEIALALSHAKYLPDEAINPLTGLPAFPGSGLVASAFDDNILGFVESEGVVDEVEVFRSSYSPRAINLFSTGATQMLRWPEFHTTYVWRDTTLPQEFVGGAVDSLGAPNLEYLNVTGGLPPPNWLPEEVPSVALPLMCRFRTYPQSNSLGLNSFSTTQMQALSALPAWRVYSAGGQDGAGTWFQVQPDNPAAGGTVPNGGFLPGGGRTATQFDTLLYWAQADFVIEVSRGYTHWFDMGSSLNTGDAVGTLVEPADVLQPAGTSIEVEFRGSAQVDHPADPLSSPSPLTTADSPFDAYGDFASETGSVSTPGPWVPDFTELEDQTYKYFQVRVTFVADAAQGVEPRLDGLGVVYLE